MPAWAYRDPATIGDGRPIGVMVSRETVQTPASSTPHDRYYTQARRLYIRNLVKLMRGR